MTENDKFEGDILNSYYIMMKDELAMFQTKEQAESFVKQELGFEMMKNILEKDIPDITETEMFTGDRQSAVHYKAKVAVLTPERYKALLYAEKRYEKLNQLYFDWKEKLSDDD